MSEKTKVLIDLEIIFGYMGSLNHCIALELNQAGHNEFFRAFIGRYKVSVMEYN